MAKKRKDERIEDIDETMAHRQSAPRKTDEQGAEEMIANAEAEQEAPAIATTTILDQPIGEEQIKDAFQILQKYKEGKANLEKRIVENEKWYRLRNWDCFTKQSNQQIEPTSAWLFNCLANKHADAMDNFPSPNILPREEGDQIEAKNLASIIPVILDQNDFEQVYSDVWEYKLRSGTGVYGAFWDGSKLNGLGDISIKKVDLLNLFWESGITDIQKSQNLFNVELQDNEVLLGTYPELDGKLGSSSIDIAKYTYDDSVDTSDKSAVVDWYYKKTVEGKTILHYCKFVNNVVLFATENEPESYPNGIYDHAMYPFVFDNLYSVEGTPAGFGYIDIGKSPQEYIDRGNQAILKNMLAGASPRYFVKSSSNVNEEEYADLSKDLIHVEGNVDDSIVPIDNKPLSSTYVEIINNKIDELKETTGNRDISTGGTTSGVTAASAIAAMQEAGSKLSRDNSKAAYRAYKRLIYLIIELIRQFYDAPRSFRILGEDGATQFVEYSNEAIKPVDLGIDLEGNPMGMRLPVFDIEVTAQKQSPYTKMAQNELALQFYQAGFFNPQLADQALTCLSMMDFDRKSFVVEKIQQNAFMFQQQQMMAMQMAMAQGGLPQPQEKPLPDRDAKVSAKDKEALGGNDTDESNVTKKARQETADATAPR